MICVSLKIAYELYFDLYIDNIEREAKPHCTMCGFRPCVTGQNITMIIQSNTYTIQLISILYNINIRTRYAYDA